MTEPIVGTPLTFSELNRGMKVIDDKGTIGKIKDCCDIHNVLVVFPEGGQGLYCLAPRCIESKKSSLYSCK